MKWIKNPYKVDFILTWNGTEHELTAEDYSPLPDEVVTAFFPQPEQIEAMLPPANDARRPYTLRTLLEIYLCRWRGQWQKFVNLAGPVGKQNEAILNWMGSFEILSEKPKKTKETR